MLEESLVMEKKPCSRSSSAQPAGKPSENKKTENTNNKPKYNRRREQSNPSSSNKSANSSNNNEGARKSKGGKFADKRPRPRSQYYGSGKQNPKVADGPEYGSVFNPGSKKQNLNHLLNFTLTPRVSTTSYVRPSNISNIHHHWLLASTHKHKYNKEQFLQANCQFIVRAGEDYRKHLTDPDVLVDWPLIEQIRLRSTEAVSCPICLDEPRAAKMTRCGHVFCWPCILHYLALSDKTWRKCPICFEAVHRGDLKSVVIITQHHYRVHDEITFKLMKRERNSLLAYPVEDKTDSYELLALNDNAALTAFSKILTATVDDVEGIVRAEKMELQAGLKEVEGEPEVCFFEEALDLLQNRQSQIHVDDHANEAKNEDLVVQTVDHDEESTEDTDEELRNVAPEDVETERQTMGQKPFYFYQAVDGQNIFIIALNLRMLELQYGDLSQAPRTLTARILDRETGSMTRELRQRLRSLAHLPLTACFDLLEVDFEALLSSDIMDAFADGLRERAERRLRRERVERKRDNMIGREINLKWNRNQPTPRIRLDSTKHFPKCGAESPPPEEENSGSIPDFESRSPSLSSLVSNDQEPSQYPSFAQMLKTSGTSGTSRPRVKDSVQSLRTVTQAHDEPDDYGASAPEYQNILSDAIAEALDRIHLQQDDEAGRKKKKKKKPKVLFATGLTFAAK